MQQPMNQPEPIGGQQAVQQQMALCPVRFVYETQVLVQPGDEIQPNQTFFVNPQNPPPWMQNRPQPNPVVYVQLLSNNMIQPVQQQMDQNQLYLQQNFANIQLQQHMLPQNHQKMANIMPNMVQNVQQSIQRNERNINQNPNTGQMQANAQNMMQNQMTVTSEVPNQGNQTVEVQRQIQFMNVRPQIGQQMNGARPVMSLNQIQNMQAMSNMQNLQIQEANSGQTFEQNIGQRMPQNVNAVWPHIMRNNAMTVQNANNNNKPTNQPPQEVNKAMNNTVGTSVPNVRNFSQNCICRPIQSTRQFVENNANVPKMQQQNVPAQQQARMQQQNVPQNVQQPQQIPVQAPPTQQQYQYNQEKVNSHQIITNLAANTTYSNNPNISQKRKCESPDEIQNKIAVPPSSQPSYKNPQQGIITTKLSNEIGTNTSPVHKPKLNANNPSNQPVQMNQSTPMIIVENAEQSKQEANQIKNETRTVITFAPSASDKLIRNTVYTPARGRLLQEKISEKLSDEKLEATAKVFTKQDIIDESNFAFPIRKPLIEKTLQANPKAELEPMDALKEGMKEEMKNTGVDVYFLLHFVKKKEEKEVADAKTLNPFTDLVHTTVESWTVEDLSNHLLKYNWNKTVSVFHDHEIDGKRLFLVSKTQLVNIGVPEENAEAICAFVRSWSSLGLEDPILIDDDSEIKSNIIKMSSSNRSSKHRLCNNNNILKPVIQNSIRRPMYPGAQINTELQRTANDITNIELESATKTGVRNKRKSTLKFNNKEATLPIRYQIDNAEEEPEIPEMNSLIELADINLGNDIIATEINSNYFGKEIINPESKSESHEDTEKKIQGNDDLKVGYDNEQTIDHAQILQVNDESAVSKWNNKKLEMLDNNIIQHASKSKNKEILKTISDIIVLKKGKSSSKINKKENVNADEIIVVSNSNVNEQMNGGKDKLKENDEIVLIQRSNAKFEEIHNIEPKNNEPTTENTSTKKENTQKATQFDNFNQTQQPRFVVTHVVGGCIIQESNFPFLIRELQKPKNKALTSKKEETTPTKVKNRIFFKRKVAQKGLFQQKRKKKSQLF